MCTPNSSEIDGSASGIFRPDADEVECSTLGTADFVYVVTEVQVFVGLLYVLLPCFYVKDVEFASIPDYAEPVHFNGGVVAYDSSSMSHFGESAGTAG